MTSSSDQPDRSGGERTSPPSARPRMRAGLLDAAVEDGAVIYDPHRHVSFTLNGPAAQLWRLCDGTRTPEQLEQELAARGLPEPAKAVAVGLEQFQTLGLLRGGTPPRIRYSETSRRALLRWGTTAAVATVPVVLSLAMPTTATAQVGTCIPAGAGAPCTGTTKCCSGVGNCTTGNPSTRVCR